MNKIKTHNKAIKTVRFALLDEQKLRFCPPLIYIVMFQGDFVRKFIILGLLLFPITTYANVVWPALILEMQLLSWWWLILVGLFIEFFFVLKLLKTTPKQAAVATLSANIASALLGIILIPLAGLAWGVFPGFLFYLLKIDSFNPINWAGTFLLACAVNVVIEGFVYKIWFKLNFLFKSKLFLWFMLANAASVGVAVVHLIINPVQT